MSETVQDTTKSANDSSKTLITDFNFELVAKTKYAESLVSKDRKIIACILLEDYVPIKYFKENFEKLNEVIEKGDFNTFIFDKRALRTFHQPSMEWYYIEWKTKMISQGLTHHRKILPDLKWFKKAVEIAKRPLLKKMPESVSSKLDISYCDSLAEAVNS